MSADDVRARAARILADMKAIAAVSVLVTNGDTVDDYRASRGAPAEPGERGQK